jgi:hypothetical protein
VADGGGERRGGRELRRCEMLRKEEDKEMGNRGWACVISVGGPRCSPARPRGPILQMMLSIFLSTMAKPITNDSTKRGKYNMIPDFCKNDLTPYFQSTIKPIVLIVTNKVQYRTQK